MMDLIDGFDGWINNNEDLMKVDVFSVGW